jgi:hypothetical protein
VNHCQSVPDQYGRGLSMQLVRLEELKDLPPFRFFEDPIFPTLGSGHSRKDEFDRWVTQRRVVCLSSTRSSIRNQVRQEWEAYLQRLSSATEDHASCRPPLSHLISQGDKSRGRASQQISPLSEVLSLGLLFSFSSASSEKAVILLRTRFTLHPHNLPKQFPRALELTVHHVYQTKKNGVGPSPPFSYLRI